MLQQIATEPLLSTQIDKQISFFLPGIARTKGSVTPILAANGKGRVKPSSKHLKGWAEGCYFQAVNERNRAGICIAKGPVGLGLVVIIARPKCHFLANGSLRHDAPLFHIHPKDLDKIFRALGDAFTGSLYRDDGQIVFGCQLKRWANPGEDPGVSVVYATIREPHSYGELLALQAAA